MAGDTLNGEFFGNVHLLRSPCLDGFLGEPDGRNDALSLAVLAALAAHTVEAVPSGILALIARGSPH
jgi:hypothetical protein